MPAYYQEFQSLVLKTDHHTLLQKVASLLMRHFENVLDLLAIQFTLKLIAFGAISRLAKHLAVNVAGANPVLIASLQ